MESPQILGIGHRRRVGKDTLGQMVIEELLKAGFAARRVAFADLVKRVSFDLFSWAGLLPGSFYDRPGNEPKRETELPELGMSPREIWVGVGCRMRDVFPDVWVQSALDSGKGFQFVIVTDVRFPNEIEAIRARGGSVIRLDNPRAPLSEDEADSALAGWSDWDLEIENSGGLEDLRLKASELAADLIFSEAA